MVGEARHAIYLPQQTFGNLGGVRDALDEFIRTSISKNVFEGNCSFFLSQLLRFISSCR